MRTRSWLTFVFILLAAGLTAALMACGGGGGGGGGISYTGLTTQATIDEDNAYELAVGAWLGGAIGPNIDIFGAVVTGDELSGKSFFTMGFMPGVFTKVMDNLVISSFGTGIYAGAVQQIDEIMYGSCGGTATITGSANDQTGSFSGSINFNDYCGEALTINGLANVSGTVDLYSEEVVRFTLTFTSLIIEDDQESLTINGSFIADYAVSPFEVTMSYVIRDNDQMKTYWLKDVSFQLVGGMDYVDITNVAGRYYDPDEGYVEISVGTTIRIYDYGYWPSNGTLVLTGAKGTSGANTKARLVFLNSDSYQVEADTDGNGTFDYTEGPYSWSDGSDVTTLMDPYIFSEHTAFSDFFASSGLTGSYFMRAIVKSDVGGRTIYIEGDTVYEQIPYLPTIDLLFAPYFSYVKTFLPPYDPPGAAWENRAYTFFADDNLNGIRDAGEAYEQCYVTSGVIRQMDIPQVSVTGGNSPTISWESVSGADMYIINFFTLTPQNRLGTMVFTQTFADDGSASYSYTYNGDLFTQYDQLAVAVVAREEVSSCVLNRGLYYTVHSM